MTSTINILPEDLEVFLGEIVKQIEQSVVGRKLFTSQRVIGEWNSTAYYYEQNETTDTAQVMPFPPMTVGESLTYGFEFTKKTVNLAMVAKFWAINKFEYNTYKNLGKQGIDLLALLKEDVGYQIALKEDDIIFNGSDNPSIDGLNDLSGTLTYTSSGGSGAWSNSSTDPSVVYNDLVAAISLLEDENFPAKKLLLVGNATDLKKIREKNSYGVSIEADVKETLGIDIITTGKVSSGTAYLLDLSTDNFTLVFGAPLQTVVIDDNYIFTKYMTWETIAPIWKRQKAIVKLTV